MNKDLMEQEDNLPTSAPIIQMIERIVLNPEADIDKLERVMAMQERMLDRDQEAEFNRALVKAQSEMPLIQAKSENKQTNSFYAKLDAINASIVPVYTSNGFAVSFDTSESPLDDHIRIVAYVAHSAGHSKSFKHDLPIDDKGIQGKTNKTQMHGRASTVSYGQRYLLCMIFNVSTGNDNDGNRRTVEPYEQETIQLFAKSIQEAMINDDFWAIGRAAIDKQDLFQLANNGTRGKGDGYFSSAEKGQFSDYNKRYMEAIDEYINGLTKAFMDDDTDGMQELLTEVSSDPTDKRLVWNKIGNEVKKFIQERTWD